MVLGQLDIHMGRNKIQPLSYSIIKSGWRVELNINSKLIKFLEDNIKEDLHDLVMKKDFSIRQKQ